VTVVADSDSIPSKCAHLGWCPSGGNCGASIEIKPVGEPIAECTLKLRGGFDLGLFREFCPLLKASELRAYNVTVDLEDVHSIASSGIGILKLLSERTQRFGGSVRLINCRPEVAKLVGLFNELSVSFRIPVGLVAPGNLPRQRD
jgi:anti-anti-sigma factor